MFIERLWRSRKDECIFLDTFETDTDARAGIDWWITYDSRTRFRSARGGKTPE